MPLCCMNISVKTALQFLQNWAVHIIVLYKNLYFTTVYKKNFTVHNISVHNITVHNTTVHNMTVHNATVHNMTVHNATVRNFTVHNTNVHKTTVHNITVHSTTVHNTILMLKKCTHECAVHNTTALLTIVYCTQSCVVQTQLSWQRSKKHNLSYSLDNTLSDIQHSRQYIIILSRVFHTILSPNVQPQIEL